MTVHFMRLGVDVGFLQLGRKYIARSLATWSSGKNPKEIVKNTQTS